MPGVLTAMCVAGLTVLIPQKEEHDAPVASCFATHVTRSTIQLVAAECTAYNATYKVALNVGSVDTGTPGACPFGPYRAVAQDSGETSCLMLNAGAGDCFRTLTPRHGGHRGELSRGECGSGSEFEVTEIATGPQGGCAPEEKAVYYPQPATTICLGKP